MPNSNVQSCARGVAIAGALPEVQEWMRHIAADVSQDLGEITDREGRSPSDLRPSRIRDEVAG